MNERFRRGVASLCGGLLILASASICSAKTSLHEAESPLIDADSHSFLLQEASELRCRGGGEPNVKLFVFDQISDGRLSMSFDSSSKPAGVDGTGLEPGTCSWIDRTLKDDEWRQIQFVVTGNQAQAIPSLLNDRNNYWSFFVVNTDRGYFEAKRHQAWTAETKPDSSGTASPPQPQPNSSPASFDGKWDMRSGPGRTPFTLILKQTGDKATGTYTPGNGEITDGRISGNILLFKWSQDGGYKGNGKFEIADDGQSFSGSLDISEGSTNGTPVSCIGHRPPVSFAGCWNTTGDGASYFGQELCLKQKDDKVTSAEFDLAGTVTGNTLRFTERPTGAHRSGHFVMEDGGKSFKGSMNAGDNPDENQHPLLGTYSGPNYDKRKK